MQRDIDQYLTHLESENTISAYRNDLTQLYEHLRANGRQLYVASTPGEDTFDWNMVTIVRLVEYVEFMEGKGYAVATSARKIAAIKSFFHWLVVENIVRFDPTDSLDSPRVTRTLPRTLLPDETSRLLNAPGRNTGSIAIRDSAMFRLLYATGMRVSEMMSLDIGDADLASDYVRCFNKDGKERCIPFDRRTGELLAEYIKVARVALTIHEPSHALFVNHRGERLTRQGFWLILKEHAKAVGLPGDITPSTLRHSFAILLLASHANLRDVQELLGHANIATTQIYTQMVG